MLYLVKYIGELTQQFNRQYWADYISTSEKAYMQLWGKAHKFPKPRGININMMPFIMSRNWKQTKLPMYIHPYFNIIKQCIGPDSKNNEIGKICYLSIQETVVDGNKTQRRPGLHVETPGYLYINKHGLNNEMKQEEYTKGDGSIGIYMWECGGWGKGVYFPNTGRK
eukprot:74341_1